MGEKNHDTKFLNEVVLSLTNIPGVVGCIITDKEGSGLVGQLPPAVDKSVCESAAATLYGSSEQVIGWAKQGDLLSVLIEAQEGKLLISNAGDLNVVVMTQKDINVGLLRVSLKKASDSIESGVLGGIKVESPVVSAVAPKLEVGVEKPPAALAEVKKIKEVKPKMEEIPLPVLPEMPSSVSVPEDPAARADLVFDIYKALFLSLSIGAAKVSGVAPTRGMLRRYLPQKECTVLLDGVDIKPDATLDFNKLKENISKLPPAEREQFLKDNFGKIMSSLVGGYGSVMGYAPLKGMTKKEMEAVLKAYGEAMKSLGIFDTLPQGLLS